MAPTSCLGRGFTGRVNMAQCKSACSQPQAPPLPDTPPAAVLSGNRRCFLRLLVFCPCALTQERGNGPASCTSHNVSQPSGTAAVSAGGL